MPEQPSSSVPFLSELLTPAGPPAPSALGECIVFSSIWGRITSHQHKQLQRQQDGRDDVGPGDAWLAQTLNHRIRLLSKTSSSSGSGAGSGGESGTYLSRSAAGRASGDQQPLLLFASVLAQSCVIKASQSRGKSSSLMPFLPSAPLSCRHSSSQRQSGGEMLITHERACQAAQETVRLSLSLARVSCLKMHPFLAIPLSVCVEFLLAEQRAQNNDVASASSSSSPSSTWRAHDGVVQVAAALKDLGGVVPVSQRYLEGLSVFYGKGIL